MSNVVWRDKRKINGAFHQNKIGLWQQIYITIILSKNWSHTPYHLGIGSAERQIGK